MRLVHLSSMPGFYGGEVCLLNLAAGMQRRGHDVTCIVRPDSRLAEELGRAGVATVTMPLVDWYEPFSVTRLGRWLKATGTQILHTHLPRDYFIAAAASLGTAVVNVGSRHQLTPMSHALVKRPFLRRFEAMIAVSEAVRRGVLASDVVPGRKVVTVPNGIALDSADRHRESLRALAGVPHRTPVIGFVGRLCPSKGLETLLEAGAILTKRWPELRIFVLGDAPGRQRYRRRLEELAAGLGLGNTVRFFGYVDQAGLACRDFDVQVISSQAEPFGLVTLEAMAQSRPVVVTDSGGSPEIVRDGVEGFLFRAGDADGLARRLDCLLDSPGLRREMGRKGKSRVEGHFTLDHMLDATEEVYRRALGQVSLTEDLRSA
jgi:glycosyltransferase involved in cell wall biosynthesis